MWEFIALGVLFTLTFLVAIYMVTTRRKPTAILIQQEKTLSKEMEALAIKIGEAVAIKVSEEFIDKLGSVGYHRSADSPSIDNLEGQVLINESIIPVSVQIDVTEANVDNMAQEETKEDKGLATSKSKLAAIRKKKRKKR